MRLKNSCIRCEKLNESLVIFVFVHFVFFDGSWLYIGSKGNCPMTHCARAVASGLRLRSGVDSAEFFCGRGFSADSATETANQSLVCNI